MTDELLPLINTLELRARKRLEGRTILVETLLVETQIKWKRSQQEVPAIIVRELAVLLIEEGLKFLRAVHNTTIPSGGVDKVIEWDR